MNQSDKEKLEKLAHELIELGKKYSYKFDLEPREEHIKIPLSDGNVTATVVDIAISKVRPNTNVRLYASRDCDS